MHATGLLAIELCILKVVSTILPSDMPCFQFNHLPSCCGVLTCKERLKYNKEKVLIKTKNNCMPHCTYQTDND